MSDINCNMVLYLYSILKDMSFDGTDQYLFKFRALLRITKIINYFTKYSL